MSDNNYTATVKRLGIPDKFIEHGTQAELYRECNYDTQAIVATIKALVPAKTGNITTDIKL